MLAFLKRCLTPQLTLPSPSGRPCTKCGQEPRYPGQRWGKACMTAYDQARKQALNAETWTPPPSMPIAELVRHLVSRMPPEEQAPLFRALCHNPSSKHPSPSVEQLQQLLRLGLAAVEARRKGR